MISNPEAAEKFLRELPDVLQELRARIARLEGQETQVESRLALLEAYQPEEPLTQQVQEVLKQDEVK